LPYAEQCVELQVYGFTLTLTGKLNSGIKYLDLAIKANPRMSKNYYYMGIALRRGGAGYYPDSIKFLKYSLSAIKNDNTLVTNDEKVRQAGSVNYEIAWTMTLAGGDPAEIQYIQTAISESPSYKNVIKEEYLKGYFKELATNTDFLKLIK